MELKLHERIALIVHYLLLASGYIGIFLWVWLEVEHGEILVCVLGFACVHFWSYVHNILNRKRATERRESREIYCKSCKYKQENDK